MKKYRSLASAIETQALYPPALKKPQTMQQR